MAKNKTIEVTITDTKGTFSIFKKSDASKQNYDFSGITTIRQILSNEKARILHVIKNHKPVSIYHLAKILGRSFKSVNDDVKFLEKMGFIDLIAEKTKKRVRYKPEVIVDNLIINVKI